LQKQLQRREHLVFLCLVQVLTESEFSFGFSFWRIVVFMARTARRNHTSLSHCTKPLTLMLVAASDRPARLLSSCRQLAGPHLATGHFQWLLLVSGTTCHLVSDLRRHRPRFVSNSRQCFSRCAMDNRTITAVPHRLTSCCDIFFVQCPCDTSL